MRTAHHPPSSCCVEYPAATSSRSGRGPTSPRTRVVSMHRFYWLIDDVLAGCSRPGVGRDGDIDRDLAALRGYGIGALLTLTETALPVGALERHRIAGLHLPVDDFHAPTTTQMLDALAFLDDACATGTAVAVHCLAGQGRTGTVLAAYL